MSKPNIKSDLKTIELTGSIRVKYGTLSIYLVSPTHKRTEGRAPVWGSEFTSKRRRTTGGDPAEIAVG